jgi:hypothetical protein
MTTPTQETDHVERGLSRLIEQYKNKPRIAALLTSYLDEVQLLSDAIWSVIVERLIDQAVGYQLTVLSRLVGEEVRLDDDERQRVLVRARIAVNSSRGRGDDILNVATLLFEGIEFSLDEFFPGAMVLTVEDAISFIPELEHRMLEESAAGGVRIDVHYSADDPDDWFRFGSGPGWGDGVWIGTVSDH